MHQKSSPSHFFLHTVSCMELFRLFSHQLPHTWVRALFKTGVSALNREDPDSARGGSATLEPWCQTVRTAGSWPPGTSLIWSERSRVTRRHFTTEQARRQRAAPNIYHWSLHVAELSLRLSSSDSTLRPASRIRPRTALLRAWVSSDWSSGAIHPEETDVHYCTSAGS